MGLVFGIRFLFLDLSLVIFSVGLLLLNFNLLGDTLSLVAALLVLNWGLVRIVPDGLVWLATLRHAASNRNSHLGLLLTSRCSSSRRLRVGRRLGAAWAHAGHLTGWVTSTGWGATGGDLAVLLRQGLGHTPLA